MDTHNILIHEASQKDAVEDSLMEDNSGVLHQENNSKICLQSGIGTSPGQSTEVQGCNVSNMQSDLEQSVMLLTENEDEGSAQPPSKKLKTEQNTQNVEIVENRREDCLIDNKADKESESKISEEVSQQSDVGFLLGTTDVLPEDKNKHDENVGSNKIVTSSDVHHNRIDCLSTSKKTKINEAEETSGNKRVMKCKMVVANNQEQTFMGQPLKKLHDQDIQNLSQEMLISMTKRPVCNNSDVECPQKERVMGDQNKNEESYGESNCFSPSKETNELDIVHGSERNGVCNNSDVEHPQKERIVLGDQNKNEESYGENNYFSPSKETNQSDIVHGSERNGTASDETSTGNYVKEIAFLLIEDKNQFVENETNTKQESCEKFISNDITVDNKQNQKYEGNNETPSDLIATTKEVDCKENHCVLPAEKGNGEEVVDTAAETNVHVVIFEHKTSWTAILQNEVFKLVDVPCDSAKYSKIKTLFQSTTQKHFQLTKIVEVQNPFLYGCYLLKKAEMMSRYGHIKEEYLFHGTKIKNISSICEKNLDWRKHGSVTGNIFGKGVSLTPISCYASHYSDKQMEEKIMFAFKVAIADETEGDPNMVLPPYKDRFKTLRYDTAIKPNRQVVVKFSDNEFYPEYLLYYTGEYRSYVDYFEESDSD